MHSWVKKWASEVWMIFWSLIRIMVPVLLIVRLIELMGWIENLALLIEPIMIWVGLPGETGLVWMSAMVSNIYTGMAVFYQLGIAERLTIAQVSVLGTMILVAHALPMEATIAKATGVSLWFTLLLRIGGALVLGMLLQLVYSHFSLLQTPVPLLWQPEVSGSDWTNWFITQLNTLFAALIIIAGLTLLIQLLRLLHIERLSKMLKRIGELLIGLTGGYQTGHLLSCQRLLCRDNRTLLGSCRTRRSSKSSNGTREACSWLPLLLIC